MANYLLLRNPVHHTNFPVGPDEDDWFSHELSEIHWRAVNQTFRVFIFTPNYDKIIGRSRLFERQFMLGIGLNKQRI